MVLSKINKEINYLETNTIDNNDLDYQAYIYKGMLFNKNIKFVLGKPNFENIEKNIVFFNIYLITDNNVVAKIGVYETNNYIYKNSLDKEGDIIIEKLDDPLLFLYTKTYIQTKYQLESKDIFASEDSESDDSESDESDGESGDHDDDESDDGESDDGESGDDDGESGDDDGKSDDDSQKMSEYQKEKEKEFEDSIKMHAIVKEQTKEESDYEIANYKEKSSDMWINKYMKSHKYSIQENEGGGDCFFAVLRDALKTLDKKYADINVRSIRDVLSKDLDTTVFENYKEISKFYIDALEESNEMIGGLKTNYSKFKKAFGIVNPEDKKKILDDAKSTVDMLSKESKKKKEVKDLIDELGFMKDVKTIDDMREVIKTSKYYADVWGISALERLYNVKFIILDREKYRQGEIDNVLQCGEIDKKLQELNIFEPDYYIFVNYTQNNHYELITYDKNINKPAFKFKELPYKIKELILNKCMEKSSGLYSLIPDFKDFSTKNNVQLENKTGEIESLVSKPANDLYDDNIVIQIYNKSVDKKVGEGSGESIKYTEKLNTNILELNTIKDWRKKLDNNWPMDSFSVDGKSFLTIQHYLYSTRFVNIPEIANKFEKDSEHPAGNSLDAAKKLYDNVIKDKSYSKKLISDDDYKKDESLYLLTGLRNKFINTKDSEDASINEFRKILLLTENSKINIFKPGRGGGAKEATELMKIRKMLTK